MKQIITILIVIVVVVVVGAFFLFTHTATPTATNDYKNTTYQIDGQNVALVNGVSTVPAAPGSASQVTTTYFGNNASGDLNNDGVADTAFIVTQNTGGSGTFYYVVAALKTTTGYQGTSAFLLGDRIAPQTTEIKNGEVVVNYADRNPGEPMTTQPSLGVTKYLQVQGTNLVETQATSSAGAHCGGNMANAPTCSAGYHCAPTPGSTLPFGDVGGICVSD